MYGAKYLVFLAFSWLVGAYPVCSKDVCSYKATTCSLMQGMKLHLKVCG